MQLDMLIRTGFCVALEAQHDLGGAVPSRRDVLGHVPRILLRVHGETPGETKIANLELAVGIDEQVAGLEIAVQDVGRVDVFETAQDLVDEGLEMRVGEGLAGADNGGQIALHELWGLSARVGACVGRHTLIEVALVVVVGTGNVHIVETCYLQACGSARWSRARVRGSGTLRWPGGC
jgi:hypothetical protein